MIESLGLRKPAPSTSFVMNEMSTWCGLERGTEK